MSNFSSSIVMILLIHYLFRDMGLKDLERGKGREILVERLKRTQEL
jgi:hypothetical protein